MLKFGFARPGGFSRRELDGGGAPDDPELAAAIERAFSR